MVSDVPLKGKQFFRCRKAILKAIQSVPNFPPIRGLRSNGGGPCNQIYRTLLWRGPYCRAEHT